MYRPPLRSGFFFWGKGEGVCTLAKIYPVYCVHLTGYVTLHFRDRCGAVNRSSIQYDFHAGAGKSLPWVPEVFSRGRRGASFRRPKAEDASGAGHFLRLDRNPKPRMKASGAQGSKSHPVQCELSLKLTCDQAFFFCGGWGMASQTK